MSTLHKVRIRNFQSLRDVELELHPFTVIVGPSSSGKSAFARALRTLVSNRRGTEWITHGERVASISAETNAGTVTLTRSRTSSSDENAYKLIPLEDPTALQTYRKLGGDTPEDVSRFLGISSSTPINFAGQFDKPFLLDDSAAEVARTLGALTNVSIIFDGARESNRQKLQAAQTLKTRSADLEAVRARVPEFRALKAQEEALRTAEDLISSARELERRIARLSEATTVVDLLEPSLQKLAELASVRVPDEQNLQQALNALRSFENALGRIPVLTKAVRASEEAYRGWEEQESRLVGQYSEAAGSATRDIRTFFEAWTDRKYTVTQDGATFVETGHAVEVFVKFLEMRSEV